MANATDPDEGKNGQLEYWISSNERRSPFAIQRSSGQIYLQYALDRETQEHHSFMVFARDHGKPTRLTSSATYSVRVLDANDNRPQVDDFIYVSVPENQTTGWWWGRTLTIQFTVLIVICFPDFEYSQKFIEKW